MRKNSIFKCDFINLLEERLRSKKDRQLSLNRLGFEVRLF